jgi:Ca-activated chloride channel family protein
MRAWPAIALLIGSLGALRAQPTAPPKALPEDPNRIVVGVSNVNLQFTVTDRRGRFVTGLQKDDILVREGRNTQKILRFSSESELPLRLAILVDSSNSIRDRFRFIQEAAIEVISSVLRPRQDKALVVSFDTAAELVTDLTDDIPVLEKAVQSLRPGGGTSLYDAIFFASRDKLMQDQPLYKFRRAMVILSDGEDNQSRYTRDQALEMAQKADVTVYTISTNITRIQTDGDKVLRYLAAETGGQVFFPFKATDLNQSFENISNELRHQYNIFYRPEPLKTDGLYHPVEIRVKNRKELLVRCRKGYYAPKL